MKRKLNIFEKSENVRRVKLIFFTSLIILFIIDFVIHKHVRFSIEKIPAFYALYGFIANITLVFIANGLRKIVMRGEDYYD
ncbi:MAG: hypothetical protein DRO95_01460 [Candidatus Altiarchaeales archaeon]|nr:MAG: hypothetical protein DRO95_01460 [Candidatus Altiarchaeales archaeon]